MFISPTDNSSYPNIVFGVHLKARKTARFSSTEFEIYSPGQVEPIRVVARMRRVPRGAAIEDFQKAFAESGVVANRSNRAEHFGLELSEFTMPREFVLRSPSVSFLGLPYPIPDMYYRYWSERDGIALVQRDG